MGSETSYRDIGSHVKRCTFSAGDSRWYFVELRRVSGIPVFAGTTLLTLTTNYGCPVKPTGAVSSGTMA